ncbi:MAG: Glu/Leu/Phe/Val dehydrogenase [Candidatus Taylorbacteria bacterium]|nr:Glu/Leu/Phe/Val dehydrogenase [Candidatus Taylorbacteria bacterium]
MPDEKFDLLSAVLQLYEKAAQYIDIPSRIYQSLKYPEKVLKVRLPVRMDDGTYKIFIGWRSIHCSWPGPTKGGIRLGSGVTENEIVALSMLMTWKCGVLQLLYGGAKGGVTVALDDREEKLSEEQKQMWRERFPYKMSQRELKHLIYEYIEKISPIIGPRKDILAPDINTNPMIMGWILDKYSSIVGYTEPAIVTGKPLSVAGSEGRNEATGLGCFVTILEALEYLKNSGGLPVSGSDLTFAVQGFGNVGSAIARLLHKNGFKVVAISDKDGAIYNPKGLKIPEIMRISNSSEPLTSYKEAEVINRDDLLTLPVNILVPAATEGVITKENASKVKAWLIVEGANGPTTPEADETLEDKGILVVPDILANAGGVTVSYYEWVQGLEYCLWSLEEVERRLKAKMTGAFIDVLAKKSKHKVSMRRAAYITGLERVVQAGLARGKGI